MIVKIISLFLIGMVVLAMFGRLRLPRLPGSKRLAQTKCPKCGRFRIGKGPCGCGPSGKGRRT